MTASALMHSVTAEDGTFLWPSKSTSVLPVPSPRRFNEEIPAFPELNDPEDVDAVVLYVIEGNVIADIIPGFYPLEIQSGAGCSLSFEFPIVAPDDLPACDLVFYNTLTPNGDGDNDVWWIDNIAALGEADTQVQIFNRWGNPVWTGTSYDNENVVFNGTHTNGNALPDGTYYYVVDVGELQFNGYIELVR